MENIQNVIVDNWSKVMKSDNFHSTMAGFEAILTILWLVLGVKN
jgi:hypothetical protein